MGKRCFCIHNIFFQSVFYKYTYNKIVLTVIISCRGTCAKLVCMLMFMYNYVQIYFIRLSAVQTDLWVYTPQLPTFSFSFCKSSTPYRSGDNDLRVLSVDRPRLAANNTQPIPEIESNFIWVTFDKKYFGCPRI